MPLKIRGKEMVYIIFIIAIFIKLKDRWANGFQKSLNYYIKDTKNKKKKTQNKNKKLTQPQPGNINSTRSHLRF